jgi:osmotically-inducible protein OsmY
MKTAFVFLLIGVVAGVLGLRYYQRSQDTPLAQRAEHLASRAKDLVVDAKDAVVNQTAQWNLTPESIKEEIAKTGRVVRSNATVAGERIDDARIVTVIKGKYVVAKDLSAFSIKVSCNDGKVELSGVVAKPEDIARAITVALGTGGVRQVVSQLEVRN